MQIRFSHNYPKLHGQKTAQLLSIELCNRSDLSERFIEYDTVYEIDPAIGVCSEPVRGHYPLPNGRYIVLLFKGDHRIPFTTVRRFTEEKYHYYKNNLLKVFNIEYVSAENNEVPKRN
jgi:hypothetical protein